MSGSDHFCCPDHLTKYRRKLQGMYGDNQNGIMDLTHRKLRIIFSCGGGWEHVSVNGIKKVPTWEQMEWARLEFWPDDSTVMQLHVPLGDHINDHSYVLHLWRPIDAEIPRPPQIFV